MSTKKIQLSHFLVLIFLIACNHSGQVSAIKNLNSSDQYELITDWPNLPDDFILGNPTGIGIDTNQNIFIFHRADRVWPVIGSMPRSYIASKTILMLDRVSGKILNSWGDGVFIMPHGLTVDKNNNIWVTDVGLHQVFKFSHNGTLLMKLGKDKLPGNDTAQFNRPTDIAVASDGSFYVSDGYGNSRVVKYSATGKYLFEWGRKGLKKGEFNLPHGICVDEKGNVYVADRENKRIQVFDSTGGFLEQWNNKSMGKVYAITVDKAGKNFITIDDATSLFGLQHEGSGINLFNETGELQNQFGRMHENRKCWHHDVAVDNDGNIFVGDIFGNRIQKFRKISRE